MLDAFQYFLGALVSLLVITNPLSKISLFHSLTDSMTEAEHHRQARWAAFYAFLLMFSCLILGNLLLKFFGVSYGAVRISGGAVIAIIGHQVLFGGNTPNCVPAFKKEIEDCSFFPLAMPAIAGPGTLAVVIGYSTTIAVLDDITAQIYATVLTSIAMMITAFLCWLVMRYSEEILKKIGQSGAIVLGKLMGFILVCIGIQFMGSGIRLFLGGRIMDWMTTLIDAFQFFMGAVVSLIVISNPPSKMPLFLSLTQNHSDTEKVKVANMAGFYAFAIMWVSLVAGNILLGFFGISYAALRISGGIIVASIGAQLFFGVNKKPKANDEEKITVTQVKEEHSDVAFFPLAMPGIAGPGTIAVVIGLSTKVMAAPAFIDKTILFIFATLATLLAASASWFVMRGAKTLSRRLGQAGSIVLGKLMGFVLICIAVEFIVSGMQAFYHGA